MSEEWGQIERKEKKPGGEWWEAAKDDVEKKDTDWTERVVQVEHLTAHS